MGGGDGDSQEAYINNIIQVFLSASQTATLMQQQSVTIGTNLIIINNKGNIKITTTGNTQVYVNVIAAQTTYFEGVFDVDIIQIISQILSNEGPNFNLGDGDTQAAIMQLLTDIAVEVNLLYQMQCQTDIAIRSNTVIINNESIIDLSQEGDIVVDSATECVMNSSSLVTMRVKLEQYLSQDLTQKSTSILATLIVFVILIIFVFGFVSLTGYSILVKFAVFAVVVVAVVLGLYMLSAWVIGLPPFEPEDTKNPESAAPYNEEQDGALPEMTGYRSLHASSGATELLQFTVEETGYINFVVPCFSYRYSPNRVRIEVSSIGQTGEDAQVVGTTTFLVSSDPNVPLTVYPIWLYAGSYRLWIFNLGPDALYLGDSYVERRLIAGSSFVLFAQQTEIINAFVTVSAPSTSQLIVQFQDEEGSWLVYPDDYEDVDLRGQPAEERFQVSGEDAVINVVGVNPGDFRKVWTNAFTGEEEYGEPPKWYNVILINAAESGQVTVHLEHGLPT